MIPYIIITPLHLGPLTVHPFGVLVATGMMIGMWLGTRRARSLGIDVREYHSFLTWVLLVGFVSAHMLDAVLYHPREVMQDPWTLLRLWDGLGSFSGFFGAVIGGIAWKYFRTVNDGENRSMLRIPRFERRPKPAEILPMTDVILAVFPVAWIFGRAGCAVVHDHPGALSDSIFSVAYGAGPTSNFGIFALRYGNAPRFDLGLLELLFTIVLAAGFALSWRRSGANGWYIVAVSLIYSPVRFALDFLRAGEHDGGDPRYGFLTPGQWSSLVLFVFGLAMVWYLSMHRSRDPKISPVNLLVES